MNSLRGIMKILAFAGLCIAVIPTQSLVLLFTQGKKAYILPYWWHSAVRALFGITYEVTGMPALDKQTLFVSNHLSYMDIPLIGSILKNSFVAKSEVREWPLFGFLSTLQRTAFIERKKTQAALQKNALDARLNAGESLIIFPEGTSTDGYNVEPFKSSLFSIVLGTNKENLFIQPMTIILKSVNKTPPQTTKERRLYTWPREDDIDIGAHLWRFAKTKGAHLEIIFHKPIPAKDYKDRKALAKDSCIAVQKPLNKTEPEKLAA